VSVHLPGFLLIRVDILEQLAEWFSFQNDARTLHLQVTRCNPCPHFTSNNTVIRKGCTPLWLQQVSPQ
jgi:hypothetical protein